MQYLGKPQHFQRTAGSHPKQENQPANQMHLYAFSQKTFWYLLHYKREAQDSIAWKQSLN